jgi:hypothetical protein
VRNITLKRARDVVCDLAAQNVLEEFHDEGDREIADEQEWAIEKLDTYVPMMHLLITRSIDLLSEIADGQSAAEQLADDRIMNLLSDLTALDVTMTHGQPDTEEQAEALAHLELDTEGWEEELDADDD